MYRWLYLDRKGRLKGGSVKVQYFQTSAVSRRPHQSDSPLFSVIDCCNSSRNDSPKTPSPPNLSEGFRIIQTPPLLHHPFKPFPPGVAVLGNAHFAQHSIHPQPAHSLSGRFQILPKTASRMLAQRLCRFQQLGPCRIQMNIFADRAQISCSTAVHDQSLVAAAESMPRLPVPPVEPSGVSAQEPFYSGDQIPSGVSTAR